MSKSNNVVRVGNYEIVKRFDESFAVYGYGWWPDEYLDSDPEANEDYLRRTYGWRAGGWAVVHVAPSLAAAQTWCPVEEEV